MRTSSGLTVSSRKRVGLFPLVRVLSATTSISRFTQALAGQVVIHHDPIEVGLTELLGNSPAGDAEEVPLDRHGFDVGAVEPVKLGKGSSQKCIGFWEAVGVQIPEGVRYVFKRTAQWHCRHG